MSGRPFKQVVKRIAPSAVEWYHGLRGKSEFSGRYETWKEAMEYCTGFDASSIPSKVREALLKVNGQLAETCERCHKEFKPELPTEGIVHPH